MKIPLSTPRQIERLQKFDLLEKKINAKLMEWDPIGVGTIEGYEHNLWDEYLHYVPRLKGALQKNEPIKPILDWIEGESIGHFYTTEARRLKIAGEIEALINRQN